MPRRLLALVAAISMVGAALFIRSRLDQREEDKLNPPDLVCVTELADFCQRISETTDVNVTVEPAGQTVSRAAALGGAGNIDGWLTAGPWPAMLEERRDRLSLPDLFTTATPPVLARTKIAIAVWPDREAAMRTQCGNQPPGWKCLGTVAGKDLWRNAGGREEWGPVKIALGDAENHAAGAIAFAAAAAEYFGRPDLSTLDFDDDGFRDWVSDLKAHTPLAARLPDINSVLGGGPAVTDVLVGLDAVIRPAVAASRRQPKPNVLYPSAVVNFDLTLAVAPGRTGERLQELVQEKVADELPDLGWDIPGTPGTPLDPGLVDALRQVWKEAAD